MPKTTRAISLASTAAPVAKPVKPAKLNVTAKPVSPATAQIAAGRSNVAKPVAAVTVKPAKPATTDASPVVTVPRGLTRDALGIVRGATFFDQYSDRDSAYLRFFGSVARQHGHAATLVQIFNAGIKRDGNERKRYNPHYAGSGKATDVGAVNRLIKAGYFTRSADGNTLSATATAKAAALYTGKA